MEVSTSISLWKKIGNECFVKGSYITAVKWYSKCIDFPVSDCPDKIDALSNRAAAYLKLAWFSLALKDAESVLKEDAGHVKGIYRKSKALCGLNKPLEAIAFLKSQTSRYEDDVEKKEILMNEINIVDSIKDQVNGIYDMSKLIKLVDVETRLENMLEFTGPIKVGAVSGKGRGMLATRNISAGELILTSRAFMIVFRECGRELERNELLSKICLRLEADPESRKDVYNLFAGCELGFLEEEEALKESVNATERVGEIIVHNCFYGGVMSSKEKHSSGLWLLPSYINHSCGDCNSLWTDFGDFFFVRAFKDILEGEEILISYTTSMDCFEERKKILSGLEFSCDCTLCTYSQTLPPEGTATIAKIMQKMEIIKQKDTLDHVDGEWLQKSVTMINKLSPQTCHNFELIHFYEHLGLYFLDIDMAKAVEFSQKGFDLTDGNFLSHAAVDFAFNVILIMLVKGGRQNVKLAKKWVAKMKKNAMIVYGTLEVIKTRPGTRQGLTFADSLNQNGIYL